MTRSGSFLPLIELSILAIYALGIYISHQRYLRKSAKAKAAVGPANSDETLAKAA